eukprot:5405891-Pyramimonas_sp.AAC.1
MKDATNEPLVQPVGADGSGQGVGMLTGSGLRPCKGEGGAPTPCVLGGGPPKTAQRAGPIRAAAAGHVNVPCDASPFGGFAAHLVGE